MEDKKHCAEKLTVTYGDGHTEDFDVFMAVLASGLMIAGREGDRIFYSAAEEGFSCYSISAIAASSEVVVGLLKSLIELIAHLMEAVSPEMALEVLLALTSLSSGKTQLYLETKTIEKHPEEN